MIKCSFKVMDENKLGQGLNEQTDQNPVVEEFTMIDTKHQGSDEYESKEMSFRCQQELERNAVRDLLESESEEYLKLKAAQEAEELRNQELAKKAQEDLESLSKSEKTSSKSPEKKGKGSNSLSRASSSKQLSSGINNQVNGN